MSAPHAPAPTVGGALAAAEREPAVQVLARAFRDNPLNVAVIGSQDPERRVRVNAVGLRSLLPAAHLHGRVRVRRLDGALAAVLIAAPPSAHPLPPPSLVARLRCVAGQGLRVARRWAEVFEALAPLHPAEPHWYLGTLGVDPSRQGCGIGGGLLADWLAEVDQSRSCAYLETDRPENVAFYERAGFATLGETRILSVQVWRMQRAPTSGARAVTRH